MEHLEYRIDMRITDPTIRQVEAMGEAVRFLGNYFAAVRDFVSGEDATPGFLKEWVEGSGQPIYDPMDWENTPTVVIRPANEQDDADRFNTYPAPVLIIDYTNGYSYCVVDHGDDFEVVE